MLGAILVREHHDFDPKRFIAATAKTQEGYGSWIASQLSEPSVVVLVAEDGGTVVGYTYAGVEGMDWMSLRGPAGVLYDIVVDPDARGKGVGAKLVAATVEALQARGSTQVVLSTSVKNEPAQRLFSRAGFRQTMIEMTREL